MLTNYHTHHNRCGHAKGTVDDYVKEAVRLGYDEIGISCHVPYENFPDMLYRMKYSQMEDYLADIEQARRDYPMISVLKSFECEYFPRLLDYYKELAEKTDYLIVAQHKVELNKTLADAFKFTKPQELEAYANTLVQAFETGLFQIVAHPDVFGTKYPKWDATCEKISRQIIEGAMANGVILELNANGFRRGKQKYKEGVRYPYPLEKFWDIVAKDYSHALVMINADCHHPKLLNDEFVKLAKDFAAKRHLNVVTQL